MSSPKFPRVRIPESLPVSAGSVPSTMMRGRELSVKERKFVTNYTLLMNLGAAVTASDIYCAKPSDVGATMLKDPDVRNAVNAQLNMHAARCFVTKDRITRMLIDLKDQAEESGDYSTAARIVNDVAKMHGLVINHQKTDLTLRIEDMSEEQLKKFLGNRYDEKLVKNYKEGAIEGELVP